MASLPNPKTVTYEEWLEMPIVEDGIEEVVDGQIILMPPAGRIHALIIARLMKPLLNQLDEARFDVLVGSLGVVIRKVPLTGYFHSAPQLVVEVLSPSESRRMTQRKLRDYESIGTPEVWVVSPEAGTVEVLLLADGRLQRTAILAEGLLKPREFPNVQVDISTIWPD